MAIAGKVAITLSTENGGAWSADVTYDRLVAVKHNNNLYVSRKTVANVEPPNNEFWFLALEGFSGDDIEDIINGTTQVGNAKTLDGHEAEYFAPKTDLANYLPLTGGTAKDFNIDKHSTLGVPGMKFAIDSNIHGYLGVNGRNQLVFWDNALNNKEVLHTGNKPTGTYTGNGDATSRTINTGGIGGVIVIWSINGGIAFVNPVGCYAISGDGTSAFLPNVTWVGGNLSLATDSPFVNSNGTTFQYTVL